MAKGKRDTNRRENVAFTFQAIVIETAGIIAAGDCDTQNSAGCSNVGVRPC